MQVKDNWKKAIYITILDYSIQQIQLLGSNPSFV